MSERGWIEPIVERVVGEVLNSHVAQLRSEIVRRVAEEVAAQPASGSAQDGSNGSADLAKAVTEIQSGSSQREILRALLDASAKYAARVALFVVRGSHASGWQARGFRNNEGIKEFALDGQAVSDAISGRAAASVASGQFDQKFMAEFGAPESGEGHLQPLILKDKVAALVYADGGSNASGGMDAAAVELLVLATSTWLEVNTLRKLSHKEGAGQSGSQSPVPEAPTAAAVQSVPAFNDPFAAHAPAFSTGKAKAAAAGAGGGTPQAVAQAPAAAQSAAVEDVGVAEPAAAETPAPAEDQDVHRKAQRFARLLVDEIKLYNQAKVAEGRKNKDLYDRLKETIEKSRATYQKRYGNTAAASGDYFQHEIMRSLAEDDPSIMGANFRH